jgi:3-hydroxybutyryl-CoA dehydrogenase
MLDESQVSPNSATKVAVIGAGIMGSGIAQLAAMAGHRVACTDVQEGQLERAQESVDRSLGRFVKAQTLDAVAAAAARSRLEFTKDFNEAVNHANVVIEAVVEDLELKRTLLASAAKGAEPDALLGTNTSQLSITRIGQSIGPAAQRLVGMHFFNPPVMMKLTELICGLETSQETLSRARSFAQGLGKEVVVCCKDTPGFITSRAYAAIRLECVRMLDEGLASAEDIDKAFRLGFNFPMGPLELGDFNGLDTFLRVLDSLTEAYGERFRPTPTLRNLIAAGHFGRKSGRGFYQYDAQGRRIGPPASD